MSVSHPVAGHRFRLDAAVVLGVFLLLHAAAHGVGVSGNAQRIDDGESAALLGGAWHVSNEVALGLWAAAWAVAGLVTAAAAVEVLRRASAARVVVALAAGFSLALSVVFLWAAVVGVAIDLLLLVAVWLVPERIGLKSRAPR